MEIKIRQEIIGQASAALSYWRAVSRWALIVLAGLMPIFFLPFTNSPVAANKGLLAVILVLIAFFALLGKVFVEGKIRYPGHLITIAFALIIAIWGAATFFSLNPLTSLIGDWASPDGFFSMLMFVVLAVSAMVAFNKRDIGISLAAFLASLSLLGLFEILQLLNIFVLPFSFAKNAGFNPIGSVNDIGTLMAFGLVVACGLVSVPSVSKVIKKFLAVAIVIFMVVLLIINFWAIWVGLALAMIFLISFLSAGLSKDAGNSPYGGSPEGRQEMSEFEEYHGLQMAYFQKAWIPSVILLISILLLFIPSPLAKFIQAPVEVSPSFNATLGIAIQNLKSGHYLLGSGPNTFGSIFNLYKPAGINQTIFWSTVFTTGASAISSWAATVGILGILAILFLIGAFIWVGLSKTLDDVSRTIFVGVLLLFMMWFLYVANFTNMAFAFWGIGLFLAGTFVGKELKIFTSPPKTFLFSLVIVGLMTLSVAGVYFEINRYISEIYYSKAVSTNSGQADYVSAIKFWPYDERYFQGLSQSIFLQLNDLLAKKDTPQDALRTEFQNITTNSIAAARQAQTLNPQNPFNDVLLGSIYENLVSFVPDAANFALSSYAAAVDLDPQNPSNYLALARIEIAQADIAARDKKQEAEINGYLDKVVANLEKAINLKNDYTPARFLLVQIYDRQGRLADAIKRAEELVSLNVNDTGSLFQLGFLYYKNNQFDQAKLVFERTVELSANYSNARYFLGLIYDRDAATKDKALEQFQKISELNPDNAEVKQIVANLTAKKPALFNISPPTPAPQNRTEAPVQEGTKPPVQKLKK